MEDLYGVKHILRNRQNFGKRHLILSDSLTATCAISRGRSQIYKLRRVCCQIGALALCSNSCFHIRWIPSEWNPADNPSRGVWKPSIPKQFFGDGDISQSDDVRAHSLEQSETPVEGEGGVRNDTTTKRIEASISTQGGSNKFGGHRVADRNTFKEEEQESKTDSQGTNQRHSPEQDSFGRSFSFKGLPQQIFVPLVGSSEPSLQLQGHLEECEAGGSTVGQFFREEVPRGRRHQHRTIHRSQCGIFQP